MTKEEAIGENRSIKEIWECSRCGDFKIILKIGKGVDWKKDYKYWG